VPLLGGEGKTETFGYAAAKACWPKSKRISVLTFDRCIPYSRLSVIDVVHPGGEILAWHQGCCHSDPTDPEGDDHKLLPMKRTVLMGIKKPDDHKTSVLWIIRLFGGSPCGPIARYVPGYQGIGLSKYLNTRGGWPPLSYLFMM